MPSRKTAAPFSPSSKASARRERPNDVKRIIERREAAMNEIAQLRAQNASSQFVEKVQQLLTRWWAPANWQGREELLKTADWLISLEKRAAADLNGSGESLLPRNAEV